MNKSEFQYFLSGAILYALKENEDNGGEGMTEEEIYDRVSNLSIEDEVEILKIAKVLELQDQEGREGE